MMEFSTMLEEPLTLQTAIQQAVGAASTCWDNLDGTGVFDSERALDVSESLMAAIEGTGVIDRHTVLVPARG